MTTTRRKPLRVPHDPRRDAGVLSEAKRMDDLLNKYRAAEPPRVPGRHRLLRFSPSGAKPKPGRDGPRRDGRRTSRDRRLVLRPYLNGKFVGMRGRWRRSDSNTRHRDYETRALAT